MTKLLRKFTDFLLRLEAKLRIQEQKLNLYNERIKSEIEEEKRPKPYLKKMF